MFYRPATALFWAALIALAIGSLARADIPVSNAPVCIAKDQVIEKVLTDSGDGTHFRKVTGGGCGRSREGNGSQRSIERGQELCGVLEGQ